MKGKRDMLDQSLILCLKRFLDELIPFLMFQEPSPDAMKVLKIDMVRLQFRELRF
jgi:hypothetical protein